MNFAHSPASGAMTRIGHAMRASPSRGIVVAPSGQILETVFLTVKPPVHTDLLDGYAEILAAVAKAPNRPAIHAFDHDAIPHNLSSTVWALNDAAPPAKRKR